MDFFLDKKINYVCSSSSTFYLFASLYNENKEDDKIYNLLINNDSINKLEIDEIVGKQRIMDVYSGGASAYILLGSLYFFYFLIFSKNCFCFFCFWKEYNSRFQNIWVSSMCCWIIEWK